MIDVVLKSQGVDGDIGGKVEGGAEASAFQTLTGSYIGGDPVGLGASGFVFGSDVTDANYIGCFYNNALIDSNVGANQVGTTVTLTTTLPTIVHKGGFKARLWMGTRHNVADTRPSFSTGVTWAVGDNLYITTGGLWSNVTATSRDTSHGRVILAPSSATETMEAQFF